MERKQIMYVMVFFVLITGTVNLYASEKNIFSVSSVYVDSAGVKDIMHISSDNFQKEFKPFTDKEKRQSFTNYTYWIKFKAPVDKSYFIVSKNIFIDKMVLYSPSGERWEVEKSGLLEHKEKAGYSVLDIKIPVSAAGKVCYLSVQSNCISNIDIWLIEDSLLIEKEMFKMFFYIVITGIIFAYLFAVLFLYFVSKSKELIYLAGYSLASVLMILFTNGYLYGYFSGMGDWFYKWSFVFVVDIYWGMAALLSFIIFDIKRQSGILKGMFYVMFVFLGVMMVSPLFLERQTVTIIHFGIPTLFVFFNTSVGFYVFAKKRSRDALFLSIGWLIYFALIIVWSMSKFNPESKTFFTDNGPAFGLIIEFFLFAVIGAARYYDSLKDKQVMEFKLAKVEKQKTEIEQRYGKQYEMLSPREKDVLALLAEGFLDKEIADKLEISISSIRTYIKRIFDKLGVANRTEASLIYNKFKLVKSL